MDGLQDNANCKIPSWNTFDAILEKTMGCYHGLYLLVLSNISTKFELTAWYLRCIIDRSRKWFMRLPFFTYLQKFGCSYAASRAVWLEVCVQRSAQSCISSKDEVHSATARTWSKIEHTVARTWSQCVLFQIMF